MRVAVLRFRALPRFVTWEVPETDELFADDRLLIAELRARDVDADSVAWTDAVDWGSYDLALIRSAWDYIDEMEAFFAVLERIERSSCHLANPLDVVRWNSNKSYLSTLAELGIPTVPTHRASSLTPRDFQTMALDSGWTGAVVKPTVGVGAADVQLVDPGALAHALDRLADRRSLTDYLVQPLVESVRSEGEWSFIHVDGALSHALLKRPAAGDYRAHGIYGGTVDVVEPRRDDAAQAEAMLARLPFDPLYARLDLVRLDGRLVVMELELIEPILYLALAPHAAARLAEAIVARLRDVG